MTLWVRILCDTNDLIAHVVQCAAFAPTRLPLLPILTELKNRKKTYVNLTSSNLVIFVALYCAYRKKSARNHRFS
jgi:hypothetical protein